MASVLSTVFEHDEVLARRKILELARCFSTQKNFRARDEIEYSNVFTLKYCLLRLDMEQARQVKGLQWQRISYDKNKSCFLFLN